MAAMDGKGVVVQADGNAADFWMGLFRNLILGEPGDQHGIVQKGQELGFSRQHIDRHCFIAVA